MVLNDAGQMIEEWYLKLKNKFSDIQCGEYVIMPNHIHMIIINVGADPCVCPPRKEGEHMGSPLREIVQWFKTMTTNAYIRGVKQSKWPIFHEKLWQRNYYEHIIRDEDDLNKTREYIQNNPKNWKDDEEYQS